MQHFITSHLEMIQNTGVIAMFALLCGFIGNGWLLKVRRNGNG